jgi:predicted permease
MDALIADLRHTARALARRPGLTLTALATLAVGIGAATAIFSIVYGVLLRPLPYADADRLVRVSERHQNAKSPLRESLLSNLTWHAWQQSRTIEGLSAYNAGTHTVRIGNETMRMGGGNVSPSLFGLLRARPALGRFFTDAEATADQHPVVLSQALWHTHFGGKPDVLGSSVTIDGVVHTVVGVAAAGLDFPSPSARFWVPYVIRPKPTGPESNSINVFFALARLRDGVTAAQASAEGTAASRGATRPMVADLLFGKGGPVEVTAKPLVEQMTADIKPALLVLLAGVALVLLIACANVANLLLSRGVDRHRELTVRVALGASGRRIVGHLLVESLTLSLVGGLAGIAVGWLLVRLVPTVAPADFPRLDAIRLDARMLAFALTASVIAGLAAGLFPALRSARAALASAMRDDDARSTAGSRIGRRALLAGEAALAVMLLVGATLVGRSFVNLLTTNSGFDAQGVLTARVYPTDRQRSNAAKQTLVETLLTRIGAMPGVVSAAAGNMAPFADSMYISGFSIPGATDASGQPLVARALQYVVTPGYMRALGLSVPQGRMLNDSDTGTAGRTMLVNESFVRAFLRDGKPPVGRRWADKEGHTTEIIGVVGNVRRNGPLSDAEPEIYTAAKEAQPLDREIYLVIRTTGDPLAIAPSLRTLVRELDPTAALDDVGLLTDGVSASISRPRFVMMVLVAFAGVALALAAIGLYGALSYSVAQRRRELGVRAALGASRGTLIGLVLKQGLGTTIVGLAIGIAGAAALTRLMSQLLYGVEPLDVLSFALAPTVLLGVAIAACLVPARRAAATDPAEALRGD